MLLAAAKSASIWAQPGVLGFLVVFGMAIILYFVFRSLSRHLRKIREAAMAEQEHAGSAATNGSSPRSTPS